MSAPPPDYFVKAYQFTKTTHRDTYPAIDVSKNSKLSTAGKTAILTGAGQGIGRAIAVDFAKAGGAGLVLVARSTANLEATKSAVAAANPKTKIITISADVSSEADINKIKETITSQLGDARPTVLINNAGIWGGQGLIGEAAPSAWWHDLEVNVKGPMQMISMFLNLLGKDTEGTIVNVSSFGALMVFPGGSSYAIGKFALNRITEFVAIEWPKVVTVCYHPGSIATASLDDHPDMLPIAKDTTELAAGTALYLCSPQAAYLSGRYMMANWDVEELEAKKEEIVSKDLLKFSVKGDLGVGY